MDLSHEKLDASRLAREIRPALQAQGLHVTPPAESLQGRALALQLAEGDLVTPAERERIGPLWDHLRKNLFYSRRLVLHPCDEGWRVTRDGPPAATGC